MPADAPRPLRALSLLAGLVLASGGLACFEKGTDGESGTGGGGDSGSGGDAGGGDAGGGTNDGGSSGALDCDNPPAPAAVAGPDCVTASLSCGETILATTEGGTDVIGGEGYAGWFCSPVDSSQYQGPERVYAWQHPGDGYATLSLDTPCDDLDLFAIYWEDETVCPSAKYSIGECEGETGAGGSHDMVIWNNEPRRYLVVVEGPAGEEAPFRLSAACK